MATKKHEERTSGWTNQKSRCDYAAWWDCSFLCSNSKVNPKKGLVACGYKYPDFERCKKEGFPSKNQAKKIDKTRVSTASLVNNPAFKDRSYHLALGLGRTVLKSMEEDLMENLYEVVEDICQFHRYLDKIKELSYERLQKPRLTRSTMESLYQKMTACSEKYPKNNSLKNKLDEAEIIIWPHGRQ